jgi:hypothetical protein
MITFDLGSQGRFGNQLFQIASTIGIAKTNGLNYGFKKWEYEKYFEMELPTSEYFIPKYYFVEPYFHYGVHQVEDDTQLTGYYQSSKYWENCSQKIREMFTIKNHVLCRANELFPEISFQDSCAIHVRRGDYLNNFNHGVLLYVYYHKAMQRIAAEKYYIFSDDIEWCKSTFPNSDRFVFVKIGKGEDGDMMTEFSIMTLCKKHIIANSSFSWWAAYLSGSEKVIAPKRWFGVLARTHDTKDLYEKKWRVL